MTDPQPSPQERQLLRLLALKRYETPPPRFFEDLPHRIQRSLRARVLGDDRSWWEKLRDLLLHEPMVAGSYTALGLGALLFGVSVFETARSAGDPSPVIAQGAFPEAPVVLDPGPASLHGGTIYRTIPTGEVGVWLAPAGYTVIPAPHRPGDDAGRSPVLIYRVSQ